jgi:hypothetical protein
MTRIQRLAICFVAGVIGGLAVVLFSHLLLALGLSATLGVSEAISLKAPKICRPLFWAGLLAIPFGLFIKTYEVRFRDFVLASGIGMLPGPVLYVYLGSTVKELADVAAGNGGRAGRGHPQTRPQEIP